ncbi:MAG TPA: DUF1080 domain-containing protein [Bryobacteraceae bacterium]|nr:DUF1080 domain-containing protein [Bryobacteraceae bacterium]
MRTLLAVALLAACPAFSADADFNGRWDITANTKPRPRAWWLELTGVGTPSPAGKFVSAYAGDMNKVDTISVENGELRFSFNLPPNRNAKAPQANPVYRARLVNGKLEGTLATGQAGPPVQWTGVRSPSIPDKDDGTWKEGTPIALFNGKDISGWKALNPETEMKWTVQDGVLRNAPPTTDIISEQKFWNFKLHVDFRIVARSNSGIGLRGRYEIQILEDYGRPPNTHGAAALYSRVAPSVNASKPAGEWQSYDIRLVGRQLTVVHNGTKVLDKVEVEGLTAIAANSDEAEPGPFIVQGDHSYVEIKSFVVTPLVH